MHGLRLLRLLVCAAAALAVAPSAASAQSVSEDGCRQAVELRALCVGLGKLGERVSAECRRLGIADDATCWSRVGRRVMRQEVADFEGSWLDSTLRFQHALGDALPFAEAPWVGTHNSYNSTSEPPTLSHTDSNQQLDMYDQLRLGVRSLEIDVKWIAGRVVVCHGEGNVGCTTERTLAERLTEVSRWLEDNPDEVLMLYLEDGIGNVDGYNAAAGVVAKAFGDDLYRPSPPDDPSCRNLPLAHTREAVRAAGARVVVVGGCGEGTWPSVSFAWPDSVRHESRPRSFTEAACAGLPHDKLVRFFEDSTFVAPAAEPTGFSSTDDGLREGTVGLMVGCGVDMLGFDQVLPGQQRLDELAWSWAEGEPRLANGDCTMQGADGRWERRGCTERHLTACRAADGSWHVFRGAVKQAVAANRCADAGMEQALPRTGRQNRDLRSAAPAGATLWLGLRPPAPS